MKMRGCEDEKMFYRPPLLEEPCAQTLSGKNRKSTSERPNIPSFNPLHHASDAKLSTNVMGPGVPSPAVASYSSPNGSKGP